MEPNGVLEPLPKNSDPYWKDAEVETIEIKKTHGCDHHFIHETAQEVSCIKCKVGYWLSIGWKLVDGHIYDKNGDFVI